MSKMLIRVTVAFWLMLALYTFTIEIYLIHNSLEFLKVFGSISGPDSEACAWATQAIRLYLSHLILTLVGVTSSFKSLVSEDFTPLSTALFILGAGVNIGLLLPPWIQVHKHGSADADLLRAAGHADLAAVVDNFGYLAGAAALSWSVICGVGVIIILGVLFIGGLDVAITAMSAIWKRKRVTSKPDLGTVESQLGEQHLDKNQAAVGARENNCM